MDETSFVYTNGKHSVRDISLNEARGLCRGRGRERILKRIQSGGLVQVFPRLERPSANRKYALIRAKRIAEARAVPVVQKISPVDASEASVFVLQQQRVEAELAGTIQVAPSVYLLANSRDLEFSVIGEECEYPLPELRKMWPLKHVERTSINEATK